MFDIEWPASPTFNIMQSSMHTPTTYLLIYFVSNMAILGKFVQFIQSSMKELKLHLGIS